MGSMGVAGLDGQSVQVTALDAGTQCAGGGALLTSADGGTAVVCNGTPADAYLYGDGSAGALTISTDTNWAVAAPPNLHFSSLTIATGATLTVPSGLVVRITGSFVNNGNVVVQQWGGRGHVTYFDESEPDAGAPSWQVARSVAAGKGIALSASENGMRTKSRVVDEAAAGTTKSEAVLVETVRVGIEGGGGGGGCGRGASCVGGAGGGTLTVLAKLSVRNAGGISADGETPISRDCAGAGGGGVIILASSTSVENSGTISAKGGNGWPNGIIANCSPGGGGGGGLVHFIAPTQSGLANVVVAGGEGGSRYSPLLEASTDTGGAGGSSAGRGGGGASLNNEIGWGGWGTSGLAVFSPRQPASVFF